jgi:hypothetical protein
MSIIVYEVVRPYTILLHKANPVRPEISDMIVLFVQPVTEESLHRQYAAGLSEGRDHRSGACGSSRN